MGCPQEDIALILGCSVDTLERRYADDVAKGKSDIRMRLRRKQLDMALKGDRTMLIWLGKQLLGQRDEQRTEHVGSIEVTHDDEAIMAAAREYAERARIAGITGAD